MLFWLFLLGMTFSFIIPAINFYLSEKDTSYIYYILYILFSVVFVLFTFLKYDGLELFANVDLTKIYPHERIINSIPAVFYYLFLWHYVVRSDRLKTYRKVLKWLLLITLIVAPLISLLNILQLDFIDIKLLTLVPSVIVLALIIVLSFLLLKDKKKVFNIIGIGFLLFSVSVLISLLFFSQGNHYILGTNPHKLYLIGMILELTMLNYALNLSNLDYREKLILKNSQLGIEALSSQMNPHFVHNSLNAIQYYVQRNEVEQSEKYLSKFSLLIRQFFEYSRRQHITIKEEIELLTLYLEIEKLRFEEKLDFNISIDEKIDIVEQHIPSMLLQAIVENAVNHGVFHKKDNGLITIYFKQLDSNVIQVRVEDNGVGINKFKVDSKISLKNKQSNSSTVLRDKIKLLNQGKKWHIDYTIIDRSEIDEIKTGTLVTIAIKQLKK